MIAALPILRIFAISVVSDVVTWDPSFIGMRSISAAEGEYLELLGRHDIMSTQSKYHGFSHHPSN